MSFVAWLAAAALSLLGHPLAPSFAAHAGAKEFCASPGPRDYAARFGEFPPIHEIPPASKKHPALGNLDFGPRTIEMYVDTEGPVVVQPDRYGVAFWDLGFLKGEPSGHPRLNWIVTAQVFSVDGSGWSLEQISHGHIRINRIGNGYQPTLNLPLSHRPGFYRFDVQISEPDGNLLGRYSSYLRVVPPSVKVRLGISNRHFRPGQRLATRPEELGTDLIFFGEAFEVQRRVGGDWRLYRPLNPAFWDGWGGLVGAGDAGRCSYLQIPAHTPSGAYRIVKGVSVIAGGMPVRGLTLTAPFHVSPH